MLKDNITFPLISRITVNSGNNSMTGIHCHLSQISQPSLSGLMDVSTLRICFTLQRYFLCFCIFRFFITWHRGKFCFQFFHIFYSGAIHCFNRFIPTVPGYIRWKKGPSATPISPDTIPNSIHLSTNSLKISRKMPASLKRLLLF